MAAAASIKYIAAILNPDKALLRGDMKQLSSLGDAALDYLKKSWPGVATPRRRHIITEMVRLSGQHLHLDFSRIFAFCLGDEDELVRAAAVNGIAEEEDERLITAFSTLLHKDLSIGVRAAAARALGKLALQGELGKISSKDTQQIYSSLLSALDSEREDRSVKIAALEAIAYLNLPRVEGLIREAYYSGDPALEISAINAMGMNCNRIWLIPLAKEVQHDNDAVRLAAVRALGELGEEDAALYLIEAVEDENPQIQEEAIHALGQIGGDEASHMLHKLIGHPEQRISSAASAALQELELCENVQFLNF